MSKTDAEAERIPAGPTDYEVGYGKPPVASRFAKGRSGNPSGRPKGARNKVPAAHEERLKTIILEEAYRDIKINDGDRQVSVPMIRAIVRAMAMGAAKGQPRAQTLFTTLLATIEQERAARHEELLEATMEYKLHWEKEIARREKLGREPPDLPFHPNQIAIDLVHGTVGLRTPTPEEEELMEACQAVVEAKGWTFHKDD